MKKLLLTVVAGTLALAAFAQEKRVPLFEVYSSSTCPPCRPANVTMKNFLSTKPAEEYVAIKYQCHFPGTGDPYATAETVGKFDAAGFNGVPAMMINGYDDSQYAGNMGATIYDNASSAAAQYKLGGTYVVDGQTVNIYVNYTPLETVASPKLHVAIIETETEKNAKTNGETKFYNVVKKLVPSINGTALTGTVIDQPGTIELSYEFKGAYRLPANGQPSSYINNATEHSVENFDNIRVVAWVQGSDNKVAQAAHLTAGTVSVNKVPSSITDVNVYPNPASNQFSINVNLKDADQVNATLVSMTGQVISNKTVQMKQGKNTVQIETANVASGAYNLIITDSKNNTYATQLVVNH